MRRLISTVMLLTLAASCTPEYDLVYHQKPIQLAAGDKVDILMVLDTSCSMRDDYTNVYYGLGRTADEVHMIEADWRIAATNADPDGPLVEVDENHPVPGWGVQEAIDQIDGDSLWGGSGVELCFETAETHSDWLRPDAMTFIIFISDESEQSLMTPDQFRDNWPTDLYITSIVGPEEVTNSPGDPGWCSAQAAPRFHAVTDYYVNICSSEPWSIVEDYNAQDEQQYKDLGRTNCGPHSLCMYYSSRLWTWTNHSHAICNTHPD